MALAAFDVAKWFINRVDRDAGDSITHLKVQKLLYFAEAWHQVMYGKELFNESFEAWAHGPVVRDVYSKLADYGWQALETFDPPTIEFTEDVVKTLQLVVDLYDQFTAKQLEELTHMDKPWIDARGDLAPEDRCTNIISKAAIKDCFEQRYGDALIEEEFA